MAARGAAATVADTTRESVVDACSRSDAAEAAWINERKTNNFEDHADPGGKGFDKFGLMLSATLFNAFRDEDLAMMLMQDLHILDEEAASRGGMIKCRQVLHLILEYSGRTAT